jgi:excisionase family DNA binding protein
MSLLSVSEVAEELDVSPRRVRQMLADGLLRGEQVGRAWIVDRGSVREAQRRYHDVGRPWSSRSAWALLALANGDEPQVSAVELLRARRRLGEGLDSVVARLRVRADERRFYAHPSVLDRLVGLPRLVRSGASAVEDYRADLIPGEVVEGYLPASDIDGVVRRLALESVHDHPNVYIRVVDDAVWPFEAGQKVAPLPVVAIDLLESSDERSRRAGRALLETLGSR